MRLSNIWISSMELARGAITEAGAHDGADAVRTVLIDSLNDAVQRTQAGGFSAADTQDCLFAVVAWLDELAMSHLWTGATTWRLAPLQRHYFATTRAGVEFFDRLEALASDATQVREVFGLALLAGFSGRYTHRTPAELADYRAALLEQIATERNMPFLNVDVPLFPGVGVRASRSSSYRRGVNPSLATLLLIFIPLIALLGLYTFLDARIETKATAVVVPSGEHADLKR